MQRVSYIMACLSLYTISTHAMWQQVIKQFPDAHASHKNHAKNKEKEIDILCKRIQKMAVESSSQKRLSTQTS